MQLNNKLRTKLSGVYREPFFKSYDLTPLNLRENLYNGNFEIKIPDFILQKHLMESYPSSFRSSKFVSSDWRNNLTNSQAEKLYDVENELFDGALILDSAWETINYDEDVAYLCGLLPFKLESSEKDIELLSLWGCGMDFSYKLDAYMLLIDGSYDEDSPFARDGIKYFETYYGKTSLALNAIKYFLEN